MGLRNGLGVALLVGLFAAAPASAATITVSTTTDELTAGQGCSLREAIATVNGDGDGDCGTPSAGANTIVLGPTTYPLTLEHFLFIGGPPTGCLSTDLPHQTDNSQDELSVAGTVQNLTIEGSGPGKTVIDACKLGDRALQVNSGATVTVKNLTITNGHAEDGGVGSAGSTDGSTGGSGDAGAPGGGIFNQGTLTLIDADVTDSHAGDGGLGGQPGPQGGSGGTGGTGADGGGIFSTGTLNISDSTISGNGAGNGGEGYAASTEFASNGNAGAGGSGGNGGGGGGIANEGGTATIDSSTITANGTGDGGESQPGPTGESGLGNGGAGGSGGSAGNGAGLASAVGGTLETTNDTVEGNTAGNGASGSNGGLAGSNFNMRGQPGNGGNGGYGGGVLSTGSTTQLLNLTIAANATGSGALGGQASDEFPNGGTAGSNGHGGGVYASGSPATLQNTLLYANKTGGNCRGTITDDGHNLDYLPPAIGPVQPPPTDPCSETHFLTGDPKLATLANNGGPTQTMRLQPGSAAINQIPPVDSGCPSTDQRGVARPGGPTCDVGAYEVAAPTVTNESASQVGQTGATVSATVAANQASATVQFQYGTSTAYGSSTPQQQIPGLASTGLQTKLTGLKPGTTYHFRAEASSIDGTTSGSDGTFKTSPLPPRITTLKIKPTRVKRKHGAKVSYNDSEAATTHFVLLRCTKVVHKRCKRYRKVRTFKHHDKTGHDSFKLRVKGLKLGRYELTATPTFDSTKGATRKVTFQIVS